MRTHPHLRLLSGLIALGVALPATAHADDSMRADGEGNSVTITGTTRTQVQSPGRPDTGPATQCSGRAVRALIGDLTFLHDAMSLNRGRCESEPDLQVIVVDDAGGAIFSTLEYSAVTPARIFDRFFTAPQRADVPALARALGACVHQPTTLSELRHVLTRPVRGLSVVHTRVAGRGGG